MWVLHARQARMGSLKRWIISTECYVRFLAWALGLPMGRWEGPYFTLIAHCPWEKLNTTIISWVRRDESLVIRLQRENRVVAMGNWLQFQWQLVGLRRHWQQSAGKATGDSVSVNVGNEVSCPWLHRIFKTNALSSNFRRALSLNW